MDSPPSLSFSSSTARTRQDLVSSTADRLVPWLNKADLGCDAEDLVARCGDVRPDRRGEPVLERKGLGSVASDIAVLRQLEEPEVRPRHEETELHEHVRRRAEQDHQHVRHEQVDSGQGLRVSAVIPQDHDLAAAHLDADLEAAEELKLMLRDELGEGDEEADLQT